MKIATIQGNIKTNKHTTEQMVLPHAPLHVTYLWSTPTFESKLLSKLCRLLPHASETDRQFCFIPCLTASGILFLYKGCHSVKLQEEQQSRKNVAAVHDANAGHRLKESGKIVNKYICRRISFQETTETY